MVIQNTQVIDQTPALSEDAIGDSQALVASANPAVGLPVSHVQENRPLWIHSRRSAESRHRDSAMFFAELGEQELIQQGMKRFSVRNLATSPGWH